MTALSGFLRNMALSALLVAMLIGFVWSCQELLARSYSDDPNIHCHAYTPFDIECKWDGRG